MFSLLQVAAASSIPLARAAAANGQRREPHGASCWKRCGGHRTCSRGLDHHRRGRAAVSGRTDHGRPTQCWLGAHMSSDARMRSRRGRHSISLDREPSANLNLRDVSSSLAHCTGEKPSGSCVPSQPCWSDQQELAATDARDRAPCPTRSLTQSFVERNCFMTSSQKASAAKRPGLCLSIS